MFTTPDTMHCNSIPCHTLDIFFWYSLVSKLIIDVSLKNCKQNARSLPSWGVGGVGGTEKEACWKLQPFYEKNKINHEFDVP